MHPPINTDLPSSESESSSEDEFEETTGILGLGGVVSSLNFLRQPRRFDSGMVQLAIHAEENGKMTPMIRKWKSLKKMAFKGNWEGRLEQIRKQIEAGTDLKLKRQIELQKHANASNDPKNVRPRAAPDRKKAKATRNHSSLGLLQHKHHRHRHHSWGRQVSALQVAIHLQHSELLQHPLLKHLLNDKWSAYARSWYHISVAMMFVHVVAVTLAGWTWPSKYALEKHNQEFLSGAEDQSFLAHLWTFRVMSMMALAGSTYLLLIEIYQMCSQGVVAYFIYYNMVENVLVLVHTVTVVVAAILYFKSGFTFWVNISASIAIVFAWFLFLYKLRGLRHLGALIAMIEKIFRNDMVGGLGSCSVVYSVGWLQLLSGVNRSLSS